jgi:Putative metallopeptidase
MLQFGTGIAEKTIMGTAYFLYVAGANAQYNTPVRQRYYNILCVAYGADPVKFSALQAYNRNELQMDLPRDRASDCALRFAGAQHQNTYEGEYEKLTAAFKTLILGPYTDPELLKKLLVVDPLKYP